MKLSYIALLTLLLTPLAIFGRGLQPADSVRGLAWAQNGSPMMNHCTAWAWGSGEGQGWVTAGHCVTNDSDGELTTDDMYIDKVKVHVLKVDRAHDLALLTGPFAVGLEVSSRTPKVQDPVWSIQYPIESTEAFTFWGALSHPGYAFSDGGGKYAVLNLSTAPGASGAPVLNDKNQVISVVQIELCRGIGYTGFCAVSGGATLAELREFLYPPTVFSPPLP